MDYVSELWQYKQWGVVTMVVTYKKGFRSKFDYEIDHMPLMTFPEFIQKLQNRSRKIKLKLRRMVVFVQISPFLK